MLGPLLALESARACADATDRLWIVDGTLVPVRDRKVGASSRNYRFSAKVQVIVDAETRPVVAAARPVPGNTADAKAWRDSGLAEHCEGVTVLGDGAYINTGLIVPHHRCPGSLPPPGHHRRQLTTAETGPRPSEPAAGHRPPGPICSTLRPGCRFRATVSRTSTPTGSPGRGEIR